MKKSRPFKGYIVNGRPVTVEEGIKAGIIPDPKRDPNKKNPDIPEESTIKPVTKAEFKNLFKNWKPQKRVICLGEEGYKLWKELGLI